MIAAWCKGSRKLQHNPSFLTQSVCGTYSTRRYLPTVTWQLLIELHFYFRRANSTQLQDLPWVPFSSSDVFCHVFYHTAQALLFICFQFILFHKQFQCFLLYVFHSMQLFSVDSIALLRYWVGELLMTMQSSAAHAGNDEHKIAFILSLCVVAIKTTLGLWEGGSD